MNSDSLRVGVDASNIRAGGGVTHLAELLKAAEIRSEGIAKVTVWGGKDTLNCLPRHSWLHLQHERELDGPLLRRLAWQRTKLTVLAKESCDVLFVPGGSYTGSFRPFITMAQNQLLFESHERQRYRFSRVNLRLKILKKTQHSTFRRAAGVIFLTNTTRQIVERRLGPSGKHVVIPHGINPSFCRAPRNQQFASSYSATRPFRFLYVSIVDLYKHQWHVVEAVAELRARGIAVELELVGPSYPPALRRLRKAIGKFDPQGQFIHYRGPAANGDLVKQYQEADAFIFASSCESFSLVLVDAMAAGLPIACSNRSVLPEVLAGAGIYFDPEQPHEIARALESLIGDSSLREHYSRLSYERSQLYSWDRCAQQTFSFITAVARAAEEKNKVK
ncbi:MAG: glycosyltransferase family 4 protein [Acidobacteriota bacterium]|nr:glycosyltransferase family 4 protein [Acidobacteriota bacterium]